MRIDRALFALSLVAAITPINAQAAKGKYADVNGLKMYYEVHGTGKPLVVLHGAFGTAEMWSSMLPDLSKNRQVVIIEQQGHGHTADRDSPLGYRQMASDTAELLKQLKIKGADVFGYSMGGTTARLGALGNGQTALERSLIYSEEQGW
ncbi:MAG: alpha/beta fold hydrolase [Fimbriimonadales bacterium]